MQASVVVARASFRAEVEVYFREKACATATGTLADRLIATRAHLFADVYGVLPQSSHENLSPQVLQVIARELRKLLTSPPEGIKVHLNEDDLTDIQADIEGPVGTPYAGGVFRCKLVLGSEYPSAPPKAYFLTKIFHPNVSSNGDVCVNTLKKDWKSNLGITHIYQVIRCLLIVPFPESALNAEASKLFLESYDEYAKRAVLMTSIHASHKYSGASCSSSTFAAAAATEDAGYVTTAATATAAGPTTASKTKRRALGKGKKDARKRSLKRL